MVNVEFGGLDINYGGGGRIVWQQIGLKNYLG